MNRLTKSYSSFAAIAAAATFMVALHASPNDANAACSFWDNSVLYSWHFTDAYHLHCPDSNTDAHWVARNGRLFDNVQVDLGPHEQFTCSLYLKKRGYGWDSPFTKKAWEGNRDDHFSQNISFQAKRDGIRLGC